MARRTLIAILLMALPGLVNAAALLSDVFYQDQETHVDLDIRLGIPVEIQSFDAEASELTLKLRALSPAASEWYSSELRFDEEDRLLELVRLEGTDRKGYELTLRFAEPVGAQLLPQFDSHQILLKLAREKTFAGMARFGRTSDADPWAINLESRQFSVPTLADLPRGYADSKTIYVTDFETDGVLWHRLRLGFFATEREAKRTADVLGRYFPDAWIDRASRQEVQFAEAFRINPPEQMASEDRPSSGADAPPAGAESPEVRMTVDLATPSTIDADPTPEPDPAPVTWTEREPVEPAPPGETEALLLEAERAFQDQDLRTAIARYGAVVATGEEPYRQQALEMLGVARELNDQEAHAKRYYEMYLQDYAGSEGAERVAQRLAALTAFDRPQTPVTRTASTKPGTPGWTLDGQLAQFYQRQSLDVDNRTSVPINGLFNDLTLLARRHGTALDQEARVTMSYLLDFSGNDRLDGRKYQVSAAYWDGYLSSLRTGVRFGRQSNWETGALGRFDGVDVIHRFSDRFGLAMTGGYLVDRSFDGPESDRPFFGLRGEYLSDSGRLSLKPFFVQQYADGVLDRQAIGASGQYYTDRFMLFSLVDYDIHFAALNNLTLTGNLSFGRSQLSASYEHRKSPYLTTRNALMGQTLMDLTELEAAILDLTLEQIAVDRTATSDTLRVAWNQRLGDHWTLAADVVASDFSQTESSADVIGLEANRTLYSSFQVRSNDLFGRGSYSGVMLRVANSQTSDTTSLYWDNRLLFAGRWYLYGRFRADHRTFVRNDDEQWTFRPSVRVDYRLGRRIRFELESGYEWSSRDMASRTLDITGLFLRAGYRASF